MLLSDYEPHIFGWLSNAGYVNAALAAANNDGNESAAASAINQAVDALVLEAKRRASIDDDGFIDDVTAVVVTFRNFFEQARSSNGNSDEDKNATVVPEVDSTHAMRAFGSNNSCT